MKYLAFDIEAANGYQLSSICSIGVVIADENFNILHRENIWINPKTVYNLNGTRKNVGIDLHLDKKLLRSSPDFACVYGKVKALLTAEDTVVLGHAVDSDVRMLNAACERYRLPCIDFHFICTQLLYRLYKGEKDVKALNKIAAELDLEYREHNSEDDAWMSMMTLRYLLSDSGMTLDELCARYYLRQGVNDDFRLLRPVSLQGNVSKKRTVRSAVERLKNHMADIVPVDGRLEGKVFALARALELTDAAKEIVATIAAHGGRYTSKLSACNCYLASDRPTEQDVMREARVAELEKKNLCTVYTLSDLLREVSV